jgi:O-antigen/teichoic acid export membrane protein
VNYLGRVALVAALSAVGWLTPASVVGAYGVASLTGFLLCLDASFIHSRRLGCRIDRVVVSGIWSYGKWTLADTLPFFVSGQLSVYVVAFALGNSANAVLGACGNLIAPVTILLIGVMNFGLPYFSRLYAKKGHAALASRLKLFFASMCGCVFLYLLLVNAASRILLMSIFGKYGDARAIVLLLSVAALLNALFKPLDVYLRVLQKPKKMFIARSIAACINAVLVYPLVRYMGVNGAALNGVIAQGSTLVALFITARGAAGLEVFPKRCVCDKGAETS